MAPKKDRTAEPKSAEKTLEDKEAIDNGEEEVVETEHTEPREVVDGDGTKEVADKVGENTPTTTVNTPANKVDEGDGGNADPATAEEAVKRESAEWGSPEDARASAEHKWPHLFGDPDAGDGADEDEEELSTDEQPHEDYTGKAKTRGTGADFIAKSEAQPFVDANGVPSSPPFGGADPESNAKDGPVNTASDPHRKTTEVTPRDNARRIAGEFPATLRREEPVGGRNLKSRGTGEDRRGKKTRGVEASDDLDVLATKAEGKEEASKHATQLSSRQITRNMDPAQVAHAKIQALVDSYPDDTADDHILFGYGGVRVTIGDLRFLFGAHPSQHRTPAGQSATAGAEDGVIEEELETA